jgi:hypothetical protein
VRAAQQCLFEHSCSRERRPSGRSDAILTATRRRFDRRRPLPPPRISISAGHALRPPDPSPPPFAPTDCAGRNMTPGSCRACPPRCYTNDCTSATVAYSLCLCLTDVPHLPPGMSTVPILTPAIAASRSSRSSRNPVLVSPRPSALARRRIQARSVTVGGSGRVSPRRDGRTSLTAPPVSYSPR